MSLMIRIWRYKIQIYSLHYYEKDIGLNSLDRLQESIVKAVSSISFEGNT